MTAADMRTNAEKHPAMCSYDGTISFPGYEDHRPQNIACFYADGRNHFLDYGISENSMLLVSFGTPPKPGDLVIAGTMEQFAVRIFSEGEVITAPDGLVLTTTEDDTVFGVILSAMNFYH